MKDYIEIYFNLIGTEHMDGTWFHYYWVTVYTLALILCVWYQISVAMSEIKDGEVGDAALNLFFIIATPVVAAFVGIILAMLLPIAICVGAIYVLIYLVLAVILISNIKWKT